MTRRKTSSPPSSTNIAADPAAWFRTLETPEEATLNKLVGRLKGMYVETDRDKELKYELQVIIDNIKLPRDQDRPPSADNMREGISLLIVGDSGAGKTRAFRHLMKTHAAFPGYGIADSGCKLISISAPSPLILRTLGMALLRGAGYLTRREFRENEAWSRARFQIRDRGILIIHIEDIQDLLGQKDEKQIRKVMATLKGLMTDLGWPPLHLIFTALPEVTSVLKFDRQVPRRSGFIEFKPVDPQADFQMIKTAAAKYGKVAGISVAVLNSREMVGRLCHGACYQLGLVFELLVLALEVCLRAGRKVLTQEDFADAYSRRTLEPVDLNPFYGDDWLSIDTSIIKKKPGELSADDMPKRKKKKKPRYDPPEDE
jgi:Bacterial TniB protein